MTEYNNVTDNSFIELTADIVSAHVSNNMVAAADLPAPIRSVYDALARTETPPVVEVVAKEPAVSVRASIKADYLVCLEDGAQLKMLKRYLRTKYAMSPDDYRAKWGLPKDYPMVAPNYAETRRTLAHKIGLGRKPVAKTPETPTASANDAPKGAGRKRLGIAQARDAAQVHLGTAETVDA